MADKFCLKMPDFHVTFRDLLHAVNLRHGTDGFTSPPKEGVLRIFSPWKIQRLRPGLNPRTWVPKASALLLDHRSRYEIWVPEYFSKTCWRKFKFHWKFDQNTAGTSRAELGTFMITRLFFFLAVENVLNKSYNSENRSCLRQYGKNMIEPDRSQPTI